MSQNRNKSFGGVWPAMVTPLTESGDINHAAIEGLIDLFVRQRLGGVFILGSTGQWPLLTLAERRGIAERTIKAAAGRIPVMVHVGAAGTQDAVALARHAGSIGADAISCVAPIYYPSTSDVIFEHYRLVASATDRPFFVYHLSFVQQQALEPSDYAKRLLALPNIAGMKITDRDLDTFGLIQASTQGSLTLLSGADEVLCHAAVSGAAGAVGSFFNLWGAVCQSIRRAFVDGDIEIGRRFMLVFQSVLAEVGRPGRMWTFLRSAMRKKHGIDIGLPRPPLGLLAQSWSDAEVARLLARVDEFQSSENALG